MRVKKTVQVEVPIGCYVVEFDLIWGCGCKDDACLGEICGRVYVSDAEPRITLSTEKNFAGEGLNLESNAQDNHGDTHDFRPRVFKTRAEAKAHVKYTVERFKNPQPWESFIRY